MSTVERRVSIGELSEGHLQLGEREAVNLDMPQFSGHVEVRFSGQERSVPWDSRTRRLSGEFVHDEVALEVSHGTVLRWTREGHILILESLSTAAVLSSESSGGFVGYQGLPRTPRPPDGTPPASRRRRRQLETSRRSRNSVRRDFSWTGPIGISKESERSLRKAVESGGWDEPDAFNLRIRGERLASVSGFDELLGIPASKVDPMDHQVSAVSKVLKVMKGQAVLADEVGLGKTIEAGLILKELDVRGLASRVLIVVPATLREQWRAELAEKFGLDSTIVARGTDPLDGQRIIMSLHLAVRLREQLMAQGWDVVVLDEAHRAAGSGAVKTRALFEGLSSQYRLFLTATPVNNDLLELYRLVSLVRPGTFPSRAAFERQFVGADPRKPRNSADLRQLVSNVMVRTTRSQAGLDRVKRHAVDVPVQLGADEREAYGLVVRILREVLNGPQDRMRREALTRSLTLAPRALYESAMHAAERHPDPRSRQLLEQLAEVAGRSGVSSRQRTAIDRVRQWLGDPDKGRVLVFTQHTRVLQDLMRVLGEEGVHAVPYHGGMSASAKHQALEAFRGDVKVMVSTDAGAEGLNLQHANAVLNYDLPWNPMRIEQRIGRVHRVTQTRDVHVANLFAQGTIDEHVYRILVDKLQMFEILFGQVTTILGELEDSKTGELGGFEAQVKAALYAESDAHMLRRLDDLASSAGVALSRAEEQFQDSGGVSAWMAPLHEHRAQLKGEAKELRPEMVAATRDRQKEASRFVLDLLIARGATIEHRTDDFVSMRLPSDLEESFGVDTVNLAFSQSGLAQHPEAELCVVGAPLFDELLAASAHHGDLLGWTVDVSVLEAQGGRLADGHPDGWTLASREMSPLQVAGGTSHWLVADEDTRIEPQVLSFTWGDAAVSPGVHVPYLSAEIPSAGGPPLGVGSPRSFSDSVMAASIPVIEQTRQGWEDELKDAHAADKKRRLDYYKAQRGAMDGNLQQVEESIRRVSSERPPRLRTRCDLLAVEAVGGMEVEFVERWQAPDGTSVEVNGLLDAATGTIALRGTAEGSIADLAFCDAKHAMDATAVATCPRCSARSCWACPEGAWIDQNCGICGDRFCQECQTPGVACGWCDRLMCGSCDDGDLCRECSTLSPISTEELQELGLPEYLHTADLRVLAGGGGPWRTVSLSGAERRELLLVELASGRLAKWVTLSALDPGDLASALVWARSQGLTGDVVLGRGESPAADPPISDASLTLVDRAWVSDEWVAASGESSEAWPVAQAPEVRSGSERGLLDLIVPEAHGTGLLLHRRRVFNRTFIWLDDHGLHGFDAHGSDTSLEAGGWSPWARDSHADPLVEVRTADLPGRLEVRLRRSVDACVVSLIPQGDVALSGVTQAAARDAIDVCGMGTGRWALAHWLVGVEQDLRSARPGTGMGSRWSVALRRDPPCKVRLVQGDTVEAVEVATPSREGEVASLGGALLTELARGGDPRQEPVDRVELCWGSPVQLEETWSLEDGSVLTVPGHWVPGDDSVDLLDPMGDPIHDLIACGQRHPVDVARLNSCASCGGLSCASCTAPAQLASAPCGVCDRSVCNSCMPMSASCLLCERRACRSCLPGTGLCATCRGTAPRHDIVAAAIPDELVASGLPSAACRDRSRTVVHLRGRHRREAVVVDPDGTVLRWLTLAESDPELLGSALEVCLAHGLTGDILPVIETVPAIRDSVDPAALELRSSEVRRQAWAYGEEIYAVVTSTKSGLRPERVRGVLAAALNEAQDALLPEPSGDAVRVVLRTDYVVEETRVDVSGIRHVVWEAERRSEVRASWSGPEDFSDSGDEFGALVPGASRVLSASIARGPQVRVETLGRHYRVLSALIDDQMRSWDLDGLAVVSPEIAFGFGATGQYVPRTFSRSMPKLVPWDRVHGVECPLPIVSTSYAARPFGSLDRPRPIVDARGWPFPPHHWGEFELPSMRGVWELSRPFLEVLNNLVPRAEPGPVAEMEIVTNYEMSMSNLHYGRNLVVSVVNRDGHVRFVGQEGVFERAFFCAQAHAVPAEQADGTCPYCGRGTCPSCVNRIRPCVLCGFPLCGGCSGASGDCPACQDLRRVGLLQKRRLKKEHPGAAAGLRGEDVAHQVLLVLTAPRVVRDVQVAGRTTRDSAPLAEMPVLAARFANRR